MATGRRAAACVREKEKLYEQIKTDTLAPAFAPLSLSLSLSVHTATVLRTFQGCILGMRLLSKSQLYLVVTPRQQSVRSSRRAWKEPLRSLTGNRGRKLCSLYRKKIVALCNTNSCVREARSAAVSHYFYTAVHKTSAAVGRETEKKRANIIMGQVF